MMETHLEFALSKQRIFLKTHLYENSKANIQTQIYQGYIKEDSIFATSISIDQLVFISPQMLDHVNGVLLRSQEKSNQLAVLYVRVESALSNYSKESAPDLSIEQE